VAHVAAQRGDAAMCDRPGLLVGFDADIVADPDSWAIRARSHLVRSPARGRAEVPVRDHAGDQLPAQRRHRAQWRCAHLSGVSSGDPGEQLLAQGPDDLLRGEMTAGASSRAEAASRASSIRSSGEGSQGLGKCVGIAWFDEDGA